MKSRLLNRREILVLGLPFLLIGVGAMFLTAREKKRIARESGPLRVVVTSIETMPLSGAEAWQGYDLKYHLDFDIQGQGSKEITSATFWRNVEILQDNSHLSILNEKGQNQRFPGLRIPNDFYMQPVLKRPLKILEYSELKAKSNLSRLVLIDRDAFPAGKATLWLQSALWAENSDKGRVKVPDLVWSQVIDKDIQQINVDRTRPELVSNSISIIPPIAGEYRRFLNKSGWGVETSMTSLKLNWDVTGLDKRPDFNRMEFLGSRFEDSNGNEIVVKDEVERYAGMYFYHFSASTRPVYDDKYKKVPNQLSTTIDLDLRNVPQKYGAVFLRSNLSMNESWPTPFRFEVRPAWLHRKSSKLKFLSAAVRDYGISINVQYLGTKSVEYDVKEHVPYEDEPISHYFSTAEGSDKAPDPPIAPQHDRLITNWSQHMEEPEGPKYIMWTHKQRAIAKPICEVLNVIDSGYGQYEIIYKVNRQYKTPMKFKTEIGIWGDGFIPVELTIK